jgi:hypothetical protein
MKLRHRFVWHFDPAASGPRRRMFLWRWQVVASERGDWEVRHANVVLAWGRRRGLLRAQVAALRALLGCLIGGMR